MINLDPQEKKRITGQQRKALHLWLEMVAEKCNEGGITMDMILEQKTLELEVSKVMLKEVIWKPACKALFGVDSSEELEPSQVNDVFLVADRFFQKHWGINIDFPKWENIAE